MNRRGGLAWVVREVHRFSTKPDGGAINMPDSGPKGKWGGHGGGGEGAAAASVVYSTNIFLRQGRAERSRLG